MGLNLPNLIGIIIIKYPNEYLGCFHKSNRLYSKAQHNQNDLFELLDIGRTKGFGNFINRKLIWPFLLQLDSNKIKQAPMF